MSAVHVEEAGDHGPLLLCLHGIGSSSAAFAPQLAELSAYVRVVAWDAPGYAKSPDPEGPLDLDGFADAAAELIRERGGRAHVLGVSWGGVIALRLAARHPDLVESLVVADSSAGSGTDPAKAEGMRARAAELAELGPRAFAEGAGRGSCPAGRPRNSYSASSTPWPGPCGCPATPTPPSPWPPPTCGPNCPRSPRPRSSCAATRTRSPASRPRRSSPAPSTRPPT
ncbi:alpha/beta fold hydrolase [Streptomyces aureus]